MYLNTFSTASGIIHTPGHQDDTIILDGMGAKEDIEERCGFLRDSIAAATSDYEVRIPADRYCRAKS